MMALRKPFLNLQDRCLRVDLSNLRVISFTFVTTFVMLCSSVIGKAQMLSGLAGGQVPKGSEREDKLKPWLNLGNENYQKEGLNVPGEWKGFGAKRSITMPGSAIFNAKQHYDWSQHYGLRLEIIAGEGRFFHGEVIVHTREHEAKSSYRTTAPVTSRAKFSFIGSKKSETIDLPFTAFDKFYPFGETFRQIQKIEIRGRFADNQSGSISVPSVRVIAAPLLKLFSKVRSSAGEENANLKYELKVMNCSDRLQSVTLAHNPYSKHVMFASVEPDELTLESGETKAVTIRVNVTDRVPPGGRERQKIIALANGQLGGEIEFITARKLSHPYLVHTPERWQEVREKIDNYEWAKKASLRYLKHEAKDNRPGSRWPYAVAWQISRDKKYAELAKPGVHFEVGGKDLIQACEIYDMIADSGVFTDDDHARVKLEMRERMHGISLSGVANLELQQARCGFTLALTVQDFAWFEHFLYATDGVYDNIANGIMPDGWWYEGSVNYNVWVSRYICKMALAAEPFGVNMIDQYFAPGYSKEFRRLTDDVETRKQEFGGKPFQKFGKHPVPHITLDQLWDSFIDHLSHDGQIYAANDGGEWSLTSDEGFEIAYMMWRKPAFAALVKRRGEDGRSLLYGVPELPKDTPEIGTRSAYSDGIGFITLRSQTPDRHPSEQIEMSLKYGTHGAYHGHFDRTNFNSMRRYDRSFYSSGHGLWYSYASFMYGMFVQSSVNHNMVVVDGRNQESVESRRLLFHSGPKMQAAAVETKARWSCPPYLGLQMRRTNRKQGETAILNGRERLAAEDVFMPAATDSEGKEIEVANIGDWTERILQRRLAIVTDHYIVLADYLEGKEKHTFDNLLQIRGFQNIEGEGVQKTRHTEQMGTNPRLATQLITNCQWWKKGGTSRTRFRTIFDDKSHLNWRTLKGKKGDLYADVYSAWPKDSEIMVGAAPEVRRRAGWTKFSVEIDGEIVAEDEFSPWILGRKNIDLEIPSDAKTLTLRTQNEDRRKGGGFILSKGDCLFWGGGQLLLTNGGKFQFSELLKQGKLTLNGIRTKVDGRLDIEKIKIGEDYGAGPVVIAGKPFRESLPAQPNGKGEVRIDLTDLNVKGLSVELGADYPHGQVSKYQRHTYGARSKGESAQFLTVIEPFEEESSSMIQTVEALSATELSVLLRDGTEHRISIENLNSNKKPSVRFKEVKAGKVLAEEKS
tara:strand:- start:3565 stop:7158 length:3594 start_codon:yes stop_codon:yes gene_type:complete